MAELCFSVDNFILDVFSNTAADTAREYVSYGHRRCWTAAASCPYYSCPHRAKLPVRLVLPRVCCSKNNGSDQVAVLVLAVVREEERPRCFFEMLKHRRVVHLLLLLPQSQEGRACSVLCFVF